MTLAVVYGWTKHINTTNVGLGDKQKRIRAESGSPGKSRGWWRNGRPSCVHCGVIWPAVIRPALEELHEVADLKTLCRRVLSVQIATEEESPTPKSREKEPEYGFLEVSPLCSSSSSSSARSSVCFAPAAHFIQN